MLIAGHRITGIGLGTAQFAFRDGTPDDAVATVHAALDAGVRLIDTALAYTRPGVESYAEQVAAVQNRLSYADPGDLPTALACADRQVAYLAYSPFVGGTGAPPTTALEVAARHGASVQRVLLAWLRDQSPDILPLVGASRPASIRDSAAPLDLTERDRADLSGSGTN